MLGDKELGRESLNHRRLGQRLAGRWFLRVLIIAVAIMVSLGRTQPAIACICERDESFPDTPVERFNAYDTIFVGKVSDTWIEPGAIEPDTGLITLETLYVVMEVQESWKGVHTQETLLTTRAGIGSCGVPFSEGRTYLVYTNGSYVHACGSEVLMFGSDPPKLSYLEDQPTLVLEPFSVERPAEEHPPPQVNETADIVAAIALVVVLGSVVTFAIWRYRRRTIYDESDAGVMGGSKDRRMNV